MPNLFSSRFRSMSMVLLLVVIIIVLRLFYIQIMDDDYVTHARNNVLRAKLDHPPRGEIYDRNKKPLAQNIDCYDLVVIPKNVEQFDTVKLAYILGVSRQNIKIKLNKAQKYSKYRTTLLFKQLSKEAKLQIDEMNLKGFSMIYGTMRSYPNKIAGNLLGHVGEVTKSDINRDTYYRNGDYIGKSGVELSYEKFLRGKKGRKVEMVDAFGNYQGSYSDGVYDTVSKLGRPITITIDAKIQEFAEELMKGKIGSCVAIEPSSGEILAMVNTPNYDPSLLSGRDRGENYAKMSNDKTRPMFNRAVMANYPPGSTFKIVNGLIALQENVVGINDTYECDRGYKIGRGVACHYHKSPVNIVFATQTSCNAYYCQIFRDIIDNPKYKNINEGFNNWNEYVRSFGFGNKLNTDFIGELKGNVPFSEYYEKVYNGWWNSLTVLSLAIGQGELGITPLQMANLAAIVANRGYYYVPHVIKEIDGQKIIDPRFSEKQYTKIDPKHFNPIIEGMYRSVNQKGGTARLAKIKNIDFCGKTGTSQNSHGEDHSVFIGFAPRDNPQIAIAVYVEHGKWGSSVAAPIASLVAEKYITKTTKREWLIQHIKQMEIDYSSYHNYNE